MQENREFCWINCTHGVLSLIHHQKRVLMLEEDIEYPVCEKSFLWDQGLNFSPGNTQNVQNIYNH